MLDHVGVIWSSIFVLLLGVKNEQSVLVLW